MSDMTDDIAEVAKVFLTESPNWTAPISEARVTINGLDPDEWYRRMSHGRSHTMTGRRHVWPRKETDDH